MNENDTETKPVKARDGNLSKDGKWRSFPKVPNLLQYVSTGTYFARVKVNGKLFRESLDTSVFTTAKDRLPDFIKSRQRKQMPEGTIGDALTKYEWSLEHEYGLSPFTVKYRKACIKKLLESWPGLRETKIKGIKPDECKAWAAKLSGEIDAQYFNNTLGTFRAILKKGGVHEADDPTRQGDEPVRRLGVKIEQEELPVEVLTRIVEWLEKSKTWRHQTAALAIQFMAFSGTRLSEAGKVNWTDVDEAAGIITVHNAKGRNFQNHATTRYLPIIPQMRDLLAKLKAETGGKGAVMPFKSCYGSLLSARKALGIGKVTHHTFRAWFATRALESGIDVATVAQWLNHRDGGALLLKRYRKANMQHSLAMAQKFSFGGKEAA